MHIKRKTVIKAICGIFSLYLAFAFIGSTLPYLVPVPVSEEAKALFSATSYFRDGTGPDRAALIEDTADALGIRLQLLRSATQSLDICYHAVHTGSSTAAFLGEVVDAAERGVRVRILLDGKAGYSGSPVKESIAVLDSHENIECRIYNPFHPFKPWEWHAVLHDKFIIVDGAYLLLGGRNIGDRYYASDGYEGAVTHDRDVLVWNSGGEDGGVQQAEAYMELLWTSPATAANRKNPPNREGIFREYQELALSFSASNPRYFENTLDDYLSRTVPTSLVTLIHNPINPSAKEPWVAYQLRDLALGAREEVVFQTPYATANSNLLKAMGDVAEATGNLSMLTNSLASSPNYPAFSNYYSQREKFLATGSSIFEYQGTGSIHGKSVIMDGRLSAVGSFNMDDRSFYIDTETMLVIDSPQFAAVLSGALEDIRSQSLQVGTDGSYISSEEKVASPVPFYKGPLMWLVSLVSRIFQFLI